MVHSRECTRSAIGHLNIHVEVGKDIADKLFSLCTVNDPCIEGYFKPGIDPVSDLIGSGTNFGAITVKLSG